MTPRGLNYEFVGDNFHQRINMVMKKHVNSVVHRCVLVDKGGTVHGTEGSAISGFRKTDNRSNLNLVLVFSGDLKKQKNI